MSGLFSEAVHCLMADRLVCSYQTPELFSFLSVATNREEVCNYLGRIGITVEQTSDQQAFFGAYMDPEEPSARAQCTKRFRFIINNLEELVEWLTLVKKINLADRPIIPGDRIRLVDLLSRIADSPARQDELERIASRPLVGCKSNKHHTQLEALLKKFTELCFFIPVGRSGGEYIASSEWTYLYDVMAFIKDNEQLKVPERTSQQQGIFDGHS